VSTLSTLTNVQNSLFIPDMGRYVNRRPTYTLSRLAEAESRSDGEAPGPEKIDVIDVENIDSQGALIEHTQTATSLTSRLDDTHFAVLPSGEKLKGWSKEEKQELNDHVRHLLHSRREQFKRGMKGFRQYVRKRTYHLGVAL
jgi:hypothetical protein